MALTEETLVRSPSPRLAAAAPTNEDSAFLILDTESVPDGRLLAMVKYANEELTPEEAVRRAQQEARERSATGSDFLPASFQYPVAVCILRVANDFTLQRISCLDAPQYRPRAMVRDFWGGYEKLRGQQRRPPKLVTFNGKGFDLPLLEMAAFRFGCACKEYYLSRKGRYDDGHVDLLEWFGNFGAFRGMAGGMNLLAKLLGKPGKMDVAGDQVYDLFLQGKLAEINAYCMHDVLDTYFVFLRSLVMRGEITLEREHVLTLKARDWIRAKIEECPALQSYLEHWSEWEPWP